MKGLLKEKIVVSGYAQALSERDSLIAVEDMKAYFEQQLAKQLNLHKIAAPLFVKADTGVNDNLNGTERPVSFQAPAMADKPLEIVHSLAKWKRLTLGRFGFQVGEGIYTHMNAIRQDEELDNLHSLYVDQWDWEKIICKEDRHEATLQAVVEQIYGVMRATEAHVVDRYSLGTPLLPEHIHFITTQELERLHPHATPNERENAIAREKGAVFVMQIGHALQSGIKHDGRSPDYDDWTLNGDIIFWNPLLERAFEVSSMGIRVDEEALRAQLRMAGCEERSLLPFHQSLLQGKLPYTIGGGIGQSRLAMFMFRKAHIAEVQASVWPADMTEAFAAEQIRFL